VSSPKHRTQQRRPWLLIEFDAVRYLELMPPAPRQVIEARDHRLELSSGPLLMGILNATPDSFYDGGRHRDVEAQFGRARELLDQGADLIDVGGQSAVTNRPAVGAAEEIDRVVPLVERIASLGAVVSVDTYRAEVAQAAIDAGAVIVNDPSGLSDPDLGAVCARERAALVVTHTRARPKQKLRDPRYADIVEDVKRFLHGRLRQAQSLGIEPSRLLICPGPDLGKEPAQTVELLRRLDHLQELGQPILLSVSRKDFVGALLGRPPRERLAGTLAAIANGVARGAQVLRVHDVAETRDFLTVSAALNGKLETPSGLRLADELRWEQSQEVEWATSR
jgi:dihydropteroate synthase